MTHELRHLLLLTFAAAGILLRPGPPPVPGKPLPEAGSGDATGKPAAHAPAMAARAGACPAVDVHFSPNGGCEEEVVARIGEASHQIRLAAYGFTSVPIADALIAAHARGVDVAAVLDRSNRTAVNGQAGRLIASGIPVAYDARHPLQHSKYLVLDREVVITGSYNYTNQAIHNSENMLTVRDRMLAEQYSDNWSIHAKHSENP